MSANWLLAVTCSRKERAVSDALKLFAIDNYFFKRRTVIYRRGQPYHRLVAAFPRYVFVNVAAEWMWRKTREVYGVIDFVRSYKEGDIWQVTQKQIDGLLGRAEGDVLLYEEPSRFNWGDRVRITGESSLFYGSFGLYQFPAEKPGQSLLLIEMFGRYVLVSVDTRDLELDSPHDHDRRRRRGRRAGRRSRIRAHRSDSSHTSEGNVVAQPN